MSSLGRLWTQKRGNERLETSRPPRRIRLRASQGFVVGASLAAGAEVKSFPARPSRGEAEGVGVGLLSSRGFCARREALLLEETR